MFNETTRTVIAWMGLLGIPSIFAMTGFCIKCCVSYTKKLKILMKSQQAQMRSKLLEQYHKYKAQGYILESDLEDWENQYQSYHSLGQNGVLDARREALLKLPTKKEVE